jgi:hypothetical protein
MSYTNYRQYLASPEFNRIRLLAKRRSGGTCEMCKAKPSTEVHHTKYPPWGTFEWNADGLIDVCHGCHCKIHGKDN